MHETPYNDNDREHQNWADTLGQLQRGIVRKLINRATENAYYMGIELLAADPLARSPGEIFLKKDAPGKGKDNSERSTNRVVVKIDGNDTLIENQAWLWRHDDRVLKLGKGFFERAKMLRNM